MSGMQFPGGVESCLRCGDPAKRMWIAGGNILLPYCDAHLPNRAPGPATAGIVAMVRDQVKPLPRGVMEFHETVAAYAPRSLWLRFIAEHEPAS